MTGNSSNKPNPVYSSDCEQSGLRTQTLVRQAPDIVCGALIFIVCFVVFLCSPVHQVTDSAYSMLLSESLLYHQSFELGNYAIPRGEPAWVPAYYRNGDVYQLELVGDRLYYHLSPGTSILSIPFVAAMNLFGVSAANPDGTYDAAGEEKIESLLAAILMAALACVFFYTARLMLPIGWSVAVAMGGTLGSQIWSTASRAMWNETWGTLLLGIVLLLLLKQEVTRRSANPFVLGTLVSWLYLVRPTYSTHICAITLYLILFHREHILRYLITGAAWLAAFMIYSWGIYHSLVPSYYRPGRLHFAAVWSGLAGNLFSPSRGLFICVPVVIFVAYLLIRYRREIAFPRLVVMSLLVIAAHLFVTSATLQWWGGHAFGARFSTGLVPWIVLLSVLGVQARWHRLQSVLPATSSHRLKSVPLEITAGAVLLLISVVINGSGAVNRDSWAWNARPLNIDEHPERLWDWRQPQFLAGLVSPPLPATFPALRFGSIDFSHPESDSYISNGWSKSEPQYRWTEAKHATLIFSVDRLEKILLTIKFIPFLVPNKIESQRVTISLNGERIDEFSASDPSPNERTVTLPFGALRPKNVLQFDLPDAASPASFGLSNDERLLGIAVYRMEFHQAEARPSGRAQTREVRVSGLRVLSPP